MFSSTKTRFWDIHKLELSYFLNFCVTAGTFYQGRMLGKLVVGAMPLAVHDVNQDEDVLPDHR